MIDKFPRAKHDIFSTRNACPKSPVPRTCMYIYTEATNQPDSMYRASKLAEALLFLPPWRCWFYCCYLPHHQFMSTVRQVNFAP